MRSQERKQLTVDSGCDELRQRWDTHTHTAIGSTCSLQTKNASIHTDVVPTGRREQQPVYSLALTGVFLRRKRKAVHRCFHI